MFTKILYILLFAIVAFTVTCSIAYTIYVKRDKIVTGVCANSQNFEVDLKYSMYERIFEKKIILPEAELLNEDIKIAEVVGGLGFGEATIYCNHSNEKLLIYYSGRIEKSGNLKSGSKLFL